MDKLKCRAFWGAFTSVTVWVIAALLVFLWLRNSSRPQFHTISMADSSLTTDIIQHKGVVDWSQLWVDSLQVVHLAEGIDSSAFVALREKILLEEMNAGRLMTAEQMSERITGYYDKLIDVLIALFVIFSIVSYFVINNKFRKQYEEDKISIIEDLKKALIDSQTLHSDLINGISTKIENSLVTEDDISDLRVKMKKNDENFELLATVYDELNEKVAAREEIDDTEENNQKA